MRWGNPATKRQEMAEHKRPAGRKTNRPLVFGAVLLAMFMAAVEVTIVGTAMPSIVADLGGFALLGWVFSAYLLPQAISMPLWGKLADLYGRKPVFVAGTGLFLFGSLLCGLASSMPALIAFRVVQGLGAGAVQPIATTLVGDLYSLEERAKIQGYLSGVWGVSAIIGPALGALFVEYLHWSWVFWVNVPIGLLAVAGVAFFLHEDVARKPHALDWPGAALLLVSVAALMLALLQGGAAWTWTSPPSLALLAVFALGGAAFLWWERRAAEPILPAAVWRHRVIALSNAASLTTGALLIAVSSYLPTYVQGVLEHSALVAGFALTAMSIGWPLAATLSGKAMIRFGFRPVAVVGGVFLLVGAAFFVTLIPRHGPVWAALGSFFTGVGMGLATTTFVVAVQSSVDWHTRGVATAANLFMRVLGGTIGAALLGSILNTRLRAHLEAAGIAGAQDPLAEVNRLLDPAQRLSLPAETVARLQEGLALSLKAVYWGTAVLAVVSFALILFLPKKGRETS